MRRFFILLIGLVMASGSYAKGNDREYRKLIKAYGVDTTVMKASSVEDFWNMVWRRNEPLYKFFKAFDKKKPLAVKANDNVNESLSLAADYFDSLVLDFTCDAAINCLISDLGTNKVNSKVKLFVVDDPEKNAFSTPDGRIYLTSSLIHTKGMGRFQALGICAHEFAHFLLQHSKVEAYNTLKKERTNKIVAGVMTMAQAGASLYAASNGVEIDSESLQKDMYNMFESAALDTRKFRYKYSREQEIEADIIACMFLEYIGRGGEKYIEALELIKDPLEDYQYDSYSDHPTISFRVGLLRYMLAHPEIVKEEPKKCFE